MYVLLHPCFTHSLPYSSFLLPLNLARRSGKHCKLATMPGEKMTASCIKVGGDQIHLVLVISKVGRGASHGSHRAVAPMFFHVFMFYVGLLIVRLCSMSDID